jgi:hypothetical protein
MLTLIKNYKNIFLYLLKNQFDAVAKNNDHLTLSQKIVKDSYITKEDLPHLEKLNEIFGKIKEIKEEKKRNEIQKSKENWKNTSVEMLQKGFTVCDEKSFKAFREAMILAWKNDKNNDNIIIPEYNNIIKIISQKNNLNQGKNWKDNLSEKLNWKDKKLPNFSFVLVWDSFYLYTKKIDDNKNQECFQAINFNMDIFWKINKGQIEEIDNTEKSKINERFKKDNVIDNNEIDKEVSKKEINDFIKKVKFSRYKKLWIKIEIPKKPKFCENEDWEIHITKKDKTIQDINVENFYQEIIYGTHKNIEKVYLVIMKNKRLKSRDEIQFGIENLDFKTNNWIDANTEINEWNNSDFENQIKKIDIKSEIKRLKFMWYDNFYDLSLKHNENIIKWLKMINGLKKMKELWIIFFDESSNSFFGKAKRSIGFESVISWYFKDESNKKIKEVFEQLQDKFKEYFEYVHKKYEMFTENETNSPIDISDLDEDSWLDKLKKKKYNMNIYLWNLKNYMFHEYRKEYKDEFRIQNIEKGLKIGKKEYNKLLDIITKAEKKAKENED